MEFKRLQQMQIQEFIPQNDDTNNPNISTLLDDNEKLEKYLEELQFQCFELQKSKLRQPQPFQSKNTNVINKQIASLGDIRPIHKRAHLEKQLAHYLRYAGMVVKKIDSNSCIVIYNISVNGKFVAQFTIQMCKIEESDEWALKKYHLPKGFDLPYISKKYAPMTKEYIISIHKALTAQYNRLWQIDLFKAVLPSYANIQNSINGCHIELDMKIRAQNQQDNIISVSIKLQYDPLKIRPFDILTTKFGISDSIDIMALENQLEPFKLVMLQKAFMVCLRNSQNQYLCILDEDLMYYDRNMIFGNNERNEIECAMNAHFNNSDEEVIYSRNNFEDIRKNSKTSRSAISKNVESKKSYFSNKKRTNLSNRVDSDDSDEADDSDHDSDSSNDSHQENKKRNSKKTAEKKKTSHKNIKSKSIANKKESYSKNNKRQDMKKSKGKRGRPLKHINNSTISAISDVSVSSRGSRATPKKSNKQNRNNEKNTNNRKKTTSKK